MKQSLALALCYAAVALGDAAMIFGLALSGRTELAVATALASFCWWVAS